MMKKRPTWLLEYKKDIYSQTGEDGIIEKLLDTIPTTNRWCVEFGAWDGLYLTNTRHLIDKKGYSAVFIEADKRKYRELERNYRDRDNVITLNMLVGFGEQDNLDRILNGTPVPYDFDFLSVDIDGNDFHVWKAMSQYKPKTLVVEYNPTIPTNINFVQAPNRSISQGASLLALVELGKEKGYELVAALPYNAFFVRKEYYPLFHLESNSPETLRVNLDHITYLFSGYDGTIFLRGYRKAPWHGLALKESRFQITPKLLRHYPGRYSFFQKTLFALFVALTNPDRALRALSARIRARIDQP